MKALVLSHALLPLLNQTPQPQAFAPTVAVLDKISEIDATSFELMTPTSAEDLGYLGACETAPPPGFQIGVIACSSGGSLIAAVPFFVTRYDLLLALNNPLVSRWISAGFLRPRLISLGSPLTETCPLRFDPELDASQRAVVFDLMLDAFFAHANAEGIRLQAIKDLSDAVSREFDAVLLGRAFQRLVGLPVAKLALPGRSLQDFLKQQSKHFRKDFSRANNKAARVTVQHVRDISGLEPQLFDLYEATRTRGHVSSGDFDRIAPDFLSTTLAAAPNSYVGLYRLDGAVIGFSLILNDATTSIAKFIGLKYPEAHQLGLYRRCMRDLIETSYARGQSEISFGCLNYDFKVRSGCELAGNFVYFRHAKPAVNAVFARIAHHFHYDAMDDDLIKLAQSGQYAMQYRATHEPLSGDVGSDGKG